MAETAALPLMLDLDTRSFFDVIDERQLRAARQELWQRYMANVPRGLGASKSFDEVLRDFDEARKPASVRADEIKHAREYALGVVARLTRTRG